MLDLDRSQGQAAVEREEASDDAPARRRKKGRTSLDPVPGNGGRAGGAPAGTSVQGHRCCKYCPFVTAYKSAMEQHERVHTGEKPFKCATCDFRSAQKGHVQRHEERRGHGIAPPPPAPVLRPIPDVAPAAARVTSSPLRPPDAGAARVPPLSAPAPGRSVDERADPPGSPRSEGPLVKRVARMMPTHPDMVWVSARDASTQTWDAWAPGSDGCGFGSALGAVPAARPPPLILPSCPVPLHM